MKSLSVPSVFFLLLILSREVLHEDEAELRSSQQSVVALVGDDVILPCQLEPPISAVSDTVVWTKPDLTPKYVHVQRDGRPVYRSQNPTYKNRTALFVDELKNGNVSLKLHRVKISDAGKYFCYLQTMQRGPCIQLTVGAVSRPNIEKVSNNSAEVVLHCRSEGWYPEPEVSWLDGEGHVLSAGPTETVKDPDGLYTVSSRVTVETRDRNNFTCRVQQKNINQTRETQIHVPADSFMDESTAHWIWIIVALLVVLIILFVVIVVKCKNKSISANKKMELRAEVPLENDRQALEYEGEPLNTTSNNRRHSTETSTDSGFENNGSLYRNSCGDQSMDSLSISIESSQDN